jgi:aspartate aminotransferase-like enzyme
MSPPGLGFVSVSQRALDAAGQRPGGRYYFDWSRAIAEQRKDSPATPFTPAVTLLRALDVALELIEEEGLEAIMARHDLLARAARAGARGLGLELFGDPDERSTVVTAVELPDSIDGAKVPKLLRERGITANGGQGQLKGRIIRIAHCGYFGAFDVITILAGLELALNELGADVELGAGVAAAQQVFAQAGVPVAAPSA